MKFIGVVLALAALVTGCGLHTNGGGGGPSYAELLAVLAATQSIGRPASDIPSSVVCLPSGDLIHCSSFP